LRLRHGLGADQLLRARSLPLRLLQHGLRPGKRGLGRVDLDFEGLRVDAIEHIAGLHVGTLGERALGYDARDTSANLGDTGRSDPAGQLADIGSRRRLQGYNAYLGRRRCGFGDRGFAASGQDQHGRKRKPQRSGACHSAHTDGSPVQVRLQCKS